MNKIFEVPQNSKLIKFGISFFVIIMALVIEASFIWTVQNDSESGTSNIWLFYISVILFTVVSLFLYQKFKFLSNQNTTYVKSIRKFLDVLKVVVFTFGVVYYAVQLPFIQSSLKSEMPYLFKQSWCWVLSGTGYYLMNIILFLIIVLEIIYSKRGKSRVAVYIVYSILLAASLFLSPLIGLTC